MKKVLTFISFIALMSCGQKNATEHTTTDTLAKTQHVESKIEKANWIDAFRAFRTAVFQGEKQKVKRFFKFPIRNENNEIWYLAYGNDEKSLQNLASEIVPFTEADFDKYYDKIFPKTFIKSILKIKTDSLFLKSEYQTIQLYDGSTAYSVSATHDKTEKQLVLSVSYQTPARSKEEENTEYNMIYYFDIVENTIQFKQIRMAG
jgi:hypothetical protein